MKRQIFIEYDASAEAPEVPTAIEVAVEEAPVAPENEVAVEAAAVAPETGMRKHKYNIMPDMTTEEHDALKASILKNGYDKKNFPIMVSAKGGGDVIIDGWNRYKVCQELNIEFSYKLFTGTDEELLDFVMKTNTRRNLTPEQWAVIAVQNEEILQTIRKQVEATTAGKMLAGKSDPTTSVSKVKKDKNKCTTKALVAKKVNTTPKLLAAVESLKEENPEEFPDLANEILKGDTTLRKAKARKKKAVALETKAASINVLTSSFENQDKEDTDIELTDTEILQMVKKVRSEVKAMERLIMKSEMDNESIEMNLQHLKAIEKLQLDLGIRLTGFKKQNYESLNTTKTQDELSIETAEAS